MIDTQEALTACPQLDGYATELIGSHSFEVVVEKGQSLNDLFIPLTAQGVRVSSLRNKANRLEELFLSMVNGGSEQQETPALEGAAQ